MSSQASNLALAALGTFVGGNLTVMGTSFANSDNVAVGGTLTALIGAAIAIYAKPDNAARYAGYAMFGVGAVGVVAGLTGRVVPQAAKSQSTGALFGRKTSDSVNFTPPATLQIAAKQRQDRGLEPLSWSKQAVTAGLYG